MSKITDEQFEQWMSALRSGNYDQVKGTLMEVDEEGVVLGFCCLGVLVQELNLSPEVDIRCVAEEEEDWNHNMVRTLSEGPQEVYDVLNRLVGPDIYSRGVELNDDGFPFVEIADQLESLYREGKG